MSRRRDAAEQHHFKAAGWRKLCFLMTETRRLAVLCGFES